MALPQALAPHPESSADLSCVKAAGAATAESRRRLKLDMADANDHRWTSQPPKDPDQAKSQEKPRRLVLVST